MRLTREASRSAFRPRMRRGGLFMALALVGLLIAGCSSSGGSGGINFQLGLQGATNDHPATPPSVGSSGPDRQYAFVYDNQVWVRQQGASQPREVTQLTLSAGADMLWGPLVWSSSGQSLAFALVVNLTPGPTSRSSGPIYYIDVSKCLTSTSTACGTYQTPLTGSVYGHGYTWFNDDLLIAGGGGGITAYDVNDPNGPRIWQLRTTQDEPQDSDCPQPSSYGDVQVSGTSLFYACMTLGALGSTGAMGSAYLNYLSLQPYVNAVNNNQDPVSRDVAIGQAQSNNRFYGVQFASLGKVYSDPQGVPIAGVWNIRGSVLAYERIESVDAQGGKATRTICVASVYDGYCGQTVLSVGAQPTASHAQLSVGPGGAVAYQGARLYATSLSQPLAATSTFAPQWVSGDTLLVTNVTSTSTDASGVTRQVSNVQVASGAGLTTLIAAASDIALR